MPNTSLDLKKGREREHDDKIQFFFDAVLTRRSVLSRSCEEPCQLVQTFYSAICGGLTCVKREGEKEKERGREREREREKERERKAEREKERQVQRNRKDYDIGKTMIITTFKYLMVQLSFNPSLSDWNRPPSPITCGLSMCVRTVCPCACVVPTVAPPASTGVILLRMQKSEALSLSLKKKVLLLRTFTSLLLPMLCFTTNNVTYDNGGDDDDDSGGLSLSPRPPPPS